MAENKSHKLSFICLGNDYDRRDRKRKRSCVDHSDKEQLDVCEVKKQKKESRLKSVQMTMAQFANKNSINESTLTSVHSR